MFTALRRSQLSWRRTPIGVVSALLCLALTGEPMLAQTVAAAGNVVTDIATSGADDGLEIVISTARRPDASVFTLSSPSRIVVDIDEALPGRFSAPVQVNKGPVREISAREFKEGEGTITRVTILLDEVVDYTSDVGETGVRIKLASRAAGAGGEEGLDDIAAELARLGGSSEGASSGTGASGGTEVVTEVVVGSGTNSPATTSTVPAGSTTTSASSRAASGRVEIAGLDFLPFEKVSRVRISATGVTSYKARPIDADLQYVVDLSNASIPRNLQRPLDTSAFPSAVKMISAYPARDSNGTRLVVKLREKVEVSIQEEGEILYLDFPVPANIAARLPENPQGQPAAKASPTSEKAGTDKGGKSETLISQSGQKLATGGSSNDPSMSMMGLTIDDTAGGATYTGRRISIDVREADLHNVFRMISNVSKLNIVAGDNVTGKVTVRLQNVPWDQALAVVLQSKGLGAVRFGNIVRIAPLTVLKEEQTQRLEARKAADELEPLQVMILPLNYAIANDIKEQVEAALSERGQLTLDSRTNALIVEDTASGVAKARQLALSLDTQTPQVLIEARIVEVSSSFLQEFGIQWGGDVDASANTGAGTGLYFPNSVLAGGGLSTQGTPILAGSGDPNWVVDLPAASTAGALAISLGSISDIVSLDARLTAIESMGKGRVISSPKVITVDNKEAFVAQGTRIPYETVSAAGTAVQFIEATLQLTVTPHITQDDRVFLKVRVTNNRPDFGQQVNGNPAIEVKEASTEVMVRDGDTTVLGGVYTINESESVTGLPGLSKVPILGWLFKSKVERSERKELLVFITPHIVTKQVASRK